MKKLLYIIGMILMLAGAAFSAGPPCAPSAMTGNALSGYTIPGALTVQGDVTFTGDVAITGGTVEGLSSLSVAGSGASSVNISNNAYNLAPPTSILNQIYFRDQLPLVDVKPGESTARVVDGMEITKMTCPLFPTINLDQTFYAAAVAAAETARAAAAVVATTTPIFPYGPIRYYYATSMATGSVPCEMPQIAFPSGVIANDDWVETWDVPSGSLPWTWDETNAYPDRWGYLTEGEGWRVVSVPDGLATNTIIDDSGKKVLNLSAAQYQVETVYLGATPTAASLYTGAPFNADWSRFTGTETLITLEGSLFLGNHGSGAGTAYTAFGFIEGNATNDATKNGAQILHNYISSAQHVQFRTSNNGTPTDIDISSLNLTNAYHVYKITITAAGVATLYVDGVAATVGETPVTGTTQALSAYSTSKTAPFFGISNDVAETRIFKADWIRIRRE